MWIGLGVGEGQERYVHSLDPATLKKARKLSGTTCFTSLQTFTGGFVKTIATSVGQVSAIHPTTLLASQGHCSHCCWRAFGRPAVRGPLGLVMSNHVPLE